MLEGMPPPPYRKKLALPSTRRCGDPLSQRDGAHGKLPDLVAAAGRKVGRALKGFVEETTTQFKAARQKVPAPAAQRGTLRKYAIVAKAKLVQLQQTMSKLQPQIRYWLRTGCVASGKIISLHIPQLYSIVGGKAGKPVEFGLSWGIRRLAGGYLLATLAQDRRELQDTKFAVRAVKDHIALFGKAPLACVYDRG